MAFQQGTVGGRGEHGDGDGSSDSDDDWGGFNSYGEYGWWWKR